MEKYKKFSDAQTGVNPFVPDRPRETRSFPVIALKAVLGAPLCLLRLPLFVVIAPIYALLIFITDLIPLWFIRNPIQFLLHQLLARVLLFLLGFFSVDTQAANLRRFGLGRPGDDSSSASFSASSGHLVVSNYTSVAETLFLALKYGPCCFTTTVEADGQCAVVPEHFGTALYRSLDFNRPSVKQGMPLSQLLQKAQSRGWGPVILRPEGTRTNGKALLTFIPVLEDLKTAEHVSVVAFGYSYKNFCPSHSVGNCFSYLGHLCFQIYNSMTVTVLPSSRFPEVRAKTADQPLSEVTRTALTTMRAQLPKVALSWKDHVGFLDYWYSTQSTGYTKKTK